MIENKYTNNQYKELKEALHYKYNTLKIWEKF